MSKQPVIVIGAGIGGLVSALELAHAGIPVLLLERAAQPGGKMREIDAQAGHLDLAHLAAGLRRAFEQQHRDARMREFERAHQPADAGADHDDGLL